MILLQNADLKESMDALRVVNDARTIAPLTGINALLLRDTPEKVEAAYKFVQVFDKARPEVVVDVEIIEVNRAMLREYGVQIASPGSPGISGSLDVNRPGLTLADLSNLTSADVITSGIPALYYRLIKTDSRTRTLANPHMRITDGIAASFNFGQDVPVPQTVISPIVQGGISIQPQTTFNYQTIGVNVAITPRTHPNDEVSLLLNIELSTFAGTGFGGLPTFGKRAVQTTIRLHDGETNVLAGLIRDDERTAKETLPGIGDIPILGDIFARNKKEAEQTDVIVMLTPHIVRGMAVSEEDLRPLMLPREGSAALGEGGPAPAPPIIRGGGTAPAPPSFPVKPGAPSGVLPQTPLGRPGGAKLIKN
jgi:general secretion pathway protein D